MQNRKITEPISFKGVSELPTSYDSSYLQPQKLSNGTVLANPFKRSSMMDNNCAMKAGIVTVGGFGMGLVMSMFMNAVEMRDLEQVGSGRISTKMTLAKDTRKIFGTAKSFAVFGFFFSAFECQVEKLRIRDDPVNSFYAGAFTSMIISLNLLKGKSLMWTGLTGGMMGLVFYQFQFLMGGH